MASFEDVLANLDKDTRDLLKMGDEVVVTKIPTPSLGLTNATGGGFAKGSQVLIWGPKSSGKTTFCLQQIATAQKNGFSCAFMDVEGTFDPEWAERLGVDTKKMLYAPIRNMNNFVNRGISLIKAGVDIIAVDSITALMPAAYAEKDGEIKDFGDTNAIGSHSRDLSKAMSMLNGANEKRETTLILISQARMAPAGGMHWGLSSTGGQAVRFYSSTIIKLYSAQGPDYQINGEVQHGNIIYKKQIGRKVMWTVEFNKVSAQGYTGEYDLIFEDDPVGISYIGEIVDLGIKSGLITKAGAWLSYNGETLGQGHDKAVKYLTENDDIRILLEAEVSGQTISV
jgi:recombination protein RecA